MISLIAQLRMELYMLKSTMIVFVFFCILTNLTPTTILDQSETLTITPIRKKTKELCDETITCFLGNPSLAKKLEKIVENVGLEKIDAERIFSMTKTKDDQTKLYLSHAEAALIVSALKLGLTNTIATMQQYQKNYLTLDTTENSTSIREIDVKLAHAF